jgi:hypothetical protein
MTVDSVAPMTSLNQRAVVAGSNVTSAFRFWFANPSLNRGYAINAVNSGVLPTEFWGSRSEGGKHGPVLSITFAIHPQLPISDCNTNGVADDCEMLANPGLDSNNNLILDACESGACCLPDSCQVLFEAECAKAMGTYLGDNTTCGNPRCPCPPDWNEDGILNSQDFFDFLGAFFENDADYNNDEFSDSQDFFDFLTDFFHGCV